MICNYFSFPYLLHFYIIDPCYNDRKRGLVYNTIGGVSSRGVTSRGVTSRGVTSRGVSSRGVTSHAIISNIWTVPNDYRMLIL